MKIRISFFRRSLIIAIIVIFFIQINMEVCAQLSGSYTINPAGGNFPNFKSWDEAIDSLISQGVNGPVVITITPGTYEVHKIIPQITGTSSTNTIIFQSSSNDSTLVHLRYTYTSTITENYIFMLDGADYITFKSMTFDATYGDENYGTIFNIKGGANQNKFLNNVFQGKQERYYGNDNRIQIYSSGTDDENNVIENNLFLQGTKAIMLSGISSGNLASGTIIRNNDFQDQTVSSIWLKFQEAPLISGNKIEMSNNIGYNGIYLEQVDRKYQVLKNTIIINDPTEAIYINTCDGLITSRGIIANNMITVITPNNTTERCAGIRINNSTYQQVYHNSILNFSGINTNCRSLYQYGDGSNIDIRNNIFANFSSGYPYYVTNAVNISDYNNYYTTGNYLARWESNDIEYLVEMISAGSGDVHSISVNPVFDSDYDLHTTTFRLENKGTDLTSFVPDDYNGELRSTTPEIGADEFITSTGSALSGEYFIGGPSPDFPNIKKAVSELNKYGISSSVIFSIRDDYSPYAEQITILPIAGSSESNTVTMRPDPLNTEDVIISYNANINANYTLNLQGASYLTLKDLVLLSENVTYGNVITLNGFCHNDSITDCTITCASQVVNHCIYSNNSLLNKIIIDRNEFYNGTESILLSGLSGNRNNGIEISDNNFYQHSSYGISITYCSNNLKILKNKITGYSSGTKGISVSAFSGSSVSKGLIANNFVDLSESISEVTGINLSNTSYLQIFNNSVKIGEKNTSSKSEACNLYGSTNIEVLNNIFCNFGSGTAYYLNFTSSVTQSDYNVLFSAGLYLACWTDYDVLDIYELRDRSGKDLQSLAVNPNFLSENDIHVNSPFIDGSGITIPEVTSDIDGELRNSPPDIGADEFTSSVTPIQSGTYKIGGTSPDYTTVKQAFEDLQVRGISGPVILEIRDGQYNEIIGSVFEIPGSTPTDTVILRSESGNPEDIIISYSTTNNNENIFHLKGMDHFTFADLTISATGISSYGCPIRITGTSENINIINNRIISTINNGYTISIDAHTEDVLIQGNYISGNSANRGINYNGSVYELNTGTRIIGNTITGTISYAIQLNFHYAPRIIGNTIISSSDKGLWIHNSNAKIPFYGIVANNMIHMGGNITGNGIYLEEIHRIYLYHNSINITSTEKNNSSGIYITSSSSSNHDTKMINNIVSNPGGGWVLQNNYSDNIIESDYNNFYSTGANFIKWGGTPYSDLVSLQSASGKDAHSLSLDPLFYSETDLYTSQSAFDGAGTPLADVKYDIDSIPRDPEKPTIGASENTCRPPVFDILVSPTCLGDSTIFIDRSTKISPGSTFGWDFNGDYVPDEGYISDKPNDTITYYFNSPGVKNVNFIVNQVAGCVDYKTISITVSAALDVNVITKEVSCGKNDGEASVQIIQGDAPLNYFWSDGSNDTVMTGLAPGTYNVTVRDANGCTASEEFAIKESFQATVKQLKPSRCGFPDGSAVVTAIGGAEPYTYVWSNGETSDTNNTLTTGRHYVNVIDKDNCYTQAYIDIESDGSGPLITLENITNNKCFRDQDGAIDINISGGLKPYEIQWSNGKNTEDISNLAAGIYEVLVTAQDECRTAGSFEVTQPPEILVSVIVENASCTGSDGKAAAIVNGGTKPYSYKWSTGGMYQIEENLSAGIYSVKVMDVNGCNETVPVIINDEGGPVVTINSVTGVSCKDTTHGAIDIGISGGTPPYIVKWSPGGQITPDISNLSPGLYQIIVTDKAGCLGVNTALVTKTPPPVNPICLVTVDTVTGKNMVVWEKLNTIDIDYYKIYRESSVKGVYLPIGVRHVDSLSIFIDSIAEPMIRSWRYKMSVVDVCGNESELSDHHKTINLLASLGYDRVRMNLIWDYYEGFNVNTYNVYRYAQSTSWQKLTEIPANLTTYIDQTPPEEDLVYFIEAKHPTGCIATELKAETLNTSRSNRQNKLKNTGFPLNYFSKFNLAIWPNPSHDFLNISVENVNNKNVTLKLYDITGKLLYLNEYKQTGNNFETILDMSSFAAGIYHIHLNIDNVLFERILIKK